ncbi:hypothetical protein M0805_003804 [Coniferiporia weirii]|nr:hypothetical protein M0805_003804 [Coniferiporia weirii]
MGEPRRGHRREPSAVRGWLTKLRGHLTFNHRLVRRGRREMEDAHVYRERKKDRERRHRERSRSRPQGRGEYDAGDPYRNRRRPFLHFPRRCRPTYHGAHFRLLGFFTRRREHISRGLEMREEADRERRRERRRRQRQLAEEGLAIRIGAKTLIRPDGPRHHRRRGHRREDSGAPIVHAPDMTYSRSNGHGVHIARSASRHHHDGRHNLREARPTMVARSVGSRHAYYDDGDVPIVRTVSSQQGLSDVGAVIPVARSSSRHSRQYADSGYAVAQISGSHHGHRHRRSPTEAY